jgi:hypothetical protein
MFDDVKSTGSYQELVLLLGNGRKEELDDSEEKNT